MRTALVASRMELRGVMMMPGATTAASRTAVGDEYSSGFTCGKNKYLQLNFTVADAANKYLEFNFALVFVRLTCARGRVRAMQRCAPRMASLGGVRVAEARRGAVEPTQRRKQARLPNQCPLRGRNSTRTRQRSEGRAAASGRRGSGGARKSAGRGPRCRGTGAGP